MRVLNISRNDYANMSHENANALRSIGVHCEDYSYNRHTFVYLTESKPIDIQGLTAIFRTFDIIQIFHTDNELLKVVHSHPKVIIYHTGTRYRQQPKHYDEVFKHYTILTDQCEFINGFNMLYIAPHTALRHVPKRIQEKLIVGHYPSNPEVKGTDAIIRMLEPFHNDFEIRIDTKKVTHQQNLQRVSECHIYIELFAPTQGGNPYGCFGVSAFEATGLGCLVVTNNINPWAYESVYGQSPFLTPNTEQKFVNTIKALRDRRTFDYAVDTMHSGFYLKHGIESTGKRILELIQ